MYRFCFYYMGNNSNEHNIQIHMIPVLIVNIKVEKGVKIGFFLLFPTHQNHLIEPLVPVILVLVTLASRR